jgi:hypothetical protein
MVWSTPSVGITDPSPNAAGSKGSPEWLDSAASSPFWRMRFSPFQGRNRPGRDELVVRAGLRRRGVASPTREALRARPQKPLDLPGKESVSGRFPLSLEGRHR